MRCDAGVTTLEQVQRPLPNSIIPDYVTPLSQYLLALADRCAAGTLMWATSTQRANKVF